MSYPPYGGGYPQQGGYPGQPPQPQYGGGGYQQYPGQGNVSMPTPESASAAAYGTPAGGMPYPANPSGPGGIGFGDVSQPAGYPGQPQPGYGAPPSQPGYGAPPSQPGFGAPPPAQPGYGAPPQGYGPSYGNAPPPQQPMGGPPQPGYGASQQGYPQACPPAQPGYGGQPAGYGAPQPSVPTQAPYGAPQQQPASAPSYGGAPGYNTQAPGQGYGGGAPSAPGYNTGVPSSGKPGSATGYKIKEEGTLKPVKNFNPESDAAILRKAMKGFGTDEKAIVDVLGYRTCSQRQQIKSLFKTMYGKDLVKELKSELGGRFEDVIVALMLKEDEYDASELKRAMRGIGTDEDALIEILCTRTNAQIKAINEVYKKMYGRTLEQDIISDTSGHYKRLMVSMANGGRMENQPLDMNKAQQDAQRLYQAGEKKLGTDESTFNAILASQSFEQLRAVFDAYHKISGKDMESVIKSEMSGNLEIGMVAIVRVVRNRPGYFAQKLYHSMKGMGTDDKTLIRVIVTRAEVDMVQIKQEFQKLYGKTLDGFIRDDTSGDYRKVLLALVSQGGY